MLDWLSSRVFFLLFVVILTAAVLYVLKQRKRKEASPESWEALHAACTASTTKTGKTPEAAWITLLRASVTEDVWKPGLKPSAAENVAQVQSHPSCDDVLGDLESTARQTADAENVTSQAQPCHFYPSAPQPTHSTALRTADPEIVRVRGESGDPRIVKLRQWLMEGKTIFTFIVFPRADHEWEKIYEGKAVLEEVTEQEARFRFDGARPWMLFPECTIGYDCKRKRPLIQFRFAMAKPKNYK